MWIWASVAGFAATLTVGPQGDYDDPASALAAAEPGDTIEIGPGTYEVNLAIRDSITLAGSGIAKTRLVAATPINESAVLVTSRDLVTIRDLTLDGKEQARGMFVGRGSVLVERVAFENGSTTYSGGQIYIRDSEATIRECTFTDRVVVPEDGGQLYVRESALTVEDSQFHNASAARFGGAIFIRHSDATLRRLSFRNNDAGSGGGLSADQSLANMTIIEDSSFIDNSAKNVENGDEGFGGAAVVVGGQSSIVGNTFEQNQAAEGGGALDVTSQIGSTVEANIFRDNVAYEGGAIAAYDPHKLIIRANTLIGDVADRRGGAIYIGGSGSLDIHGNRICESAAESGAGVNFNSWSGTIRATVRHNVFSDLNAAQESSAMLAWSSHVDFTQNTVVNGMANSTTLRFDTESTGTVFNNAFVSNRGGVLSVLTPSAVQASYNLYWDNDNDLANFAEDDPIAADPEFIENLLGCDATYRPPLGSPMIDAGNPAILDDDGSPSDLGAYGGPEARLVHDLDGDGVVAEDCAPFDPDLSSPSPEVVADGMDQDCDGLDLCYVDGDGDGLGGEKLAAGTCTESGLAAQTGDCDDGDPRVTVDCTTDPAPETPGNAGEALPGIWFCGTPSGVAGWSGWGMLLVSLAFARRRSGKDVFCGR